MWILPQILLPATSVLWKIPEFQDFSIRGDSLKLFLRNSFSYSTGEMFKVLHGKISEGTSWEILGEIIIGTAKLLSG